MLSVYTIHLFYSTTILRDALLFSWEYSKGMDLPATDIGQRPSSLHPDSILKHTARCLRSITAPGSSTHSTIRDRPRLQCGGGSSGDIAPAKGLLSRLSYIYYTWNGGGGEAFKYVQCSRAESIYVLTR